jgi:hypothetical protein
MKTPISGLFHNGSEFSSFHSNTTSLIFLLSTLWRYCDRVDITFNVKKLCVIATLSSPPVILICKKNMMNGEYRNVISCWLTTMLWRGQHVLLSSLEFVYSLLFLELNRWGLKWTHCSFEWYLLKSTIRAFLPSLP